MGYFGAAKITPARRNVLVDTEIRDLLDQLEVLQHKFTNLQARVRLTSRGRARSVGRLTGRTGSTVSLGDPTRGEMTTSTPRLTSAEDALGLEMGQLNKTTSPSVSQLTETMGDGDGEQRAAILVDEGVAHSEPNDLAAQLFLLDSGLDVDVEVDAEHTQSIGTIYADASDTSVPVERDRHHLAVELAETKARLRRLRGELEDQADQLAELHDQLAETRRELSQVKEERARLADAAHSARHWQDEVDALRETAERVSQLEADNAKLKQRAHEIEYYKVRCQQLTEDLAILSDENAKRSSLIGREESSIEKVATLEFELHKTRTLLAQVEQLRNSDLDQIQKLREELGRLGLEQSARQQLQKPHMAHDQSDTESTASYASYTAALSKQLNDSVSLRLDQLETENRRLKRELEQARSGAIANSTGFKEHTIQKQNHHSQWDTELHKACEELKELKGSWDRCTHEITGGRELLSKALKLEAERDSLMAQLRDLRRKYRLRTRVRPSDEPTSADDEDEENEDEDADLGDQEPKRKVGTDCEEADSGNKTGDSTEETEQFGGLEDPMRRKTFNLPGTSSSRYRERRRKTRASLESEVIRLGLEIEQLEETNRQLTNQLTQSQTECRAKTDEIQGVKRQLETMKVQAEHNVNDATKSTELEAEVKRLKLALSSAELETRKARRELRDIHENLSSTEQGKLLVSKISHLEIQLTKATQAQQTATSQHESRVKQLEQEQNGLTQQLSAERQTVLTLREQLVEAKIELQQRGNTLKQFQLGLESLGVDKEKAQSVVASEQTNSVTLQDLVNGLVQRAVEQKHVEVKQLEEQLRQLRQSQPTKEPTTEGSGDMLNGSMGGEKQTQLLIQLKNRLIELEREVSEANRLRAMVESAHAAEAHLTADYYHLQRLHEKLTRDYDTLGLSLKESKESQRRMKNELSSAYAQIERLQSASDQVLSLKEALEFERGSLKGEARQLVVLREDCARLRAQVDSITENRDRERMEKTAAVERAREAKRQLEECENRAGRLTLDLDNQRNTNQKIQIELADLRSRVQSLLGQNQELLASTLETCTHRVAEEGSLR
ncbi:unnamed protein product [Echinostoma caproni]|uniref:BZIP domain-containing protein n=1 Tax=Echinostoma caproni TaxID=27848 RepID=A0A183ANB9_9TREM|nr:unnamed protein product [Echinostoma caproni]